MSSTGMIEQTAGKGAARYARRRAGRKSMGVGSNRRGGWVTYTLLTIVLLISFYPIYYTFLLASSDAQTIAQNPIPSLIPDGQFIDNVTRVLNSDIKFWQALWNSVIVAIITSISVVLFATLAGFSFAKLRFRGRRALLVFVIATMAVPTQLGVVPLFILMGEFLFRSGAMETLYGAIDKLIGRTRIRLYVVGVALAIVALTASTATPERRFCSSSEMPSFENISRISGSTWSSDSYCFFFLGAE